jgi:1-acyl-sn-glycerol-3-phosphate acyltransferase
MIFLRSLVFNVLTYTGFLLVGVLGLPALLVSPEAALGVARFWARMNVVLMRHIAGIRLEIRGTENIPHGGGLLAAKHQSALDTFSLVPSLGPFAFVLKRELNWVPVFGWYTWRAGMIPVNRGGRSAALRAITESARRAVRKGRTVIIYPEGTRRPAGAPPAYKYGIVHLYKELGVPCVPVAVNSGLFWPRGAFLRYPGTAVIEFLPAIPPGLDGDTFRERLEEVIETATTRLIAEAKARGEGIEPQGAAAEAV